MLDFSKLKTPANHGDVLLAPAPAAWPPAARDNHRRLRDAKVTLLGSTLAEWRRRTRERIAGDDDRPVIVTGHQPEFIHPGVWAKHVAAMRLAQAVDGTAIHLTVDCDVVKQGDLAVPAVNGSELTLQTVRFAEARAAQIYEHLPARTPQRIEQCAQSTRAALGERFDRSLMPVFFRALGEACEARDGVEQMTAGRAAIEAEFDVRLADCRVSTLGCTPLAVDMLLHAQRFATSYNRALAEYRRDQCVRDARRPIPDLAVDDQRCEVALWVVRPDMPRRRLFVARADDTLRLFADQTFIGEITARKSDSYENLAAALERLDGCRLRPRALTLTLWARLLLADFFIHGIGGAKYDRISDRIMADYYGVAPPQMACVSATLHLDLPRYDVDPESIRRLKLGLRDLTANPRRSLPRTSEVEPWFTRRDEAVQRSIELRNLFPRDHAARRAVYLQIREADSALAKLRPDLRSVRQAELNHALRQERDNRIALGREYFFGLYDRQALESLMNALPPTSAFAV